jgi:hypothetical protein
MAKFNYCSCLIIISSHVRKALLVCQNLQVFSGYQRRILLEEEMHGFCQTLGSNSLELIFRISTVDLIYVSSSVTLDQ